MSKNRSYKTRIATAKQKLRERVKDWKERASAAARAGDREDENAYSSAAGRFEEALAIIETEESDVAGAVGNS